MKILALIPARSGSKGVPGKNIKLLNKKPLIQYTIESAIESSLFDRIVVSTNDEEIAKIAKKAGGEIPFLRPAELAEDNSPTIDTILHALNFYAEKEIFFDALCLLQPTVPFRNSQDLKEAIAIFGNSDCDSLISMRPVPHQFHPEWVYVQDEDGEVNLFTGGKQPIVRRQELGRAFHRDGSVYICKTKIIIDQRSLYGDHIVPFEMKRSPVINIDTEKDWIEAEKYISI